MWQLLLIPSVLPIAGGLALRWWFGVRVVAEHGGRTCRCDAERWETALGSPLVAGTTAAEFGRQLRLAALARWKQHDPKQAAARESSRRFGLAVPPLSIMLAVFAALVAKIPPFGAIVIVLLATALAVVFGLLSLGSELRAIATAAKALRDSRAFPRADDEEATIACAIGHAWLATLPPILRVLH